MTAWTLASLAYALLLLTVLVAAERRAGRGR
jgi:hypothetical protein